MTPAPGPDSTKRIGVLAGRREGGRAAVREHGEERRGQPFRPQSVFQVGEIAIQDRLHVGVEDGRAAALELAPFPGDLRRGGDQNTGQAARAGSAAAASSCSGWA